MNQETLIRYIVGDATTEEKSSMAEGLMQIPKTCGSFSPFANCTTLPFGNPTTQLFKLQIHRNPKKDSRS